MRLKGSVLKGTGQANKHFQIPTANLEPQYAELEEGVFTATVLLDNREYEAVCFIGKAWLVLSAPQRVEVHLLDYEGEDFYNQSIIIDTKEKIREPMRFETETQAREMMTKDMQKAVEYFKR